MKYANILTFNWRSITLFISILIGLPWLYPAIEITVLSLIFFYMRGTHERLCLKLNQKVLKGEYGA